MYCMSIWCIFKGELNILYIKSIDSASFQTITGLGVLFGFTNTLLDASSGQGAWTIVNMMQLLLLLPLMANFISRKVTNFILSNEIYTLSFSFIPITDIDKFELLEKFDFEQQNSYINDLGMESGSVMVNYMFSF